MTHASRAAPRARSAGRPSFPDAPFWIDDDPARAVARSLSDRGIAGFAIGAGIRDAALGRAPLAPGVVEILAGAGAPRVAEALPQAAREGGALLVREGPTRFVVKPLGEDPPAEAAEREARGRDFTANAVLCGLDGRVLDPLGGLGDIAGRRIRLAHPAALRDDPVRVIRLARMRILLGEDSPDPEALAEAGIYGPDASRGPGPRVLDEMARLLRLGPPERVAGALRWLDGIGALDGLALLPAVDRLERFLSACARAGLAADPAESLGVLCAVRVGRDWIGGLRPRFGDARDAAPARAASWLALGPAPGEPPQAALAREAAAAG